jgi:hypothetical protein
MSPDEIARAETDARLLALVQAAQPVVREVQRYQRDTSPARINPPAYSQEQPALFRLCELLPDLGYDRALELLRSPGLVRYAADGTPLKLSLFGLMAAGEQFEPGAELALWTKTDPEGSWVKTGGGTEAEVKDQLARQEAEHRELYVKIVDAQAPRPPAHDRGRIHRRLSGMPDVEKRRINDLFQ